MVMCDAFTAAAAEDRRSRLPPEDIFAARYVSAANAMLATSLTTAVVG